MSRTEHNAFHDPVAQYVAELQERAAQVPVRAKCTHVGVFDFSQDEQGFFECTAQIGDCEGFRVVGQIRESDGVNITKVCPHAAEDCSLSLSLAVEMAMELRIEEAAKGL